MSASPGSGWQAIGASVRGADHIRRNLPNQDAVAWDASARGSVVTVADGHGSPQCFRSSRGARLATEVTCRILSTVLEDGSAGDTVPMEIARAWRLAVAADAAAEPLTDEETLAAWGRRAGDDPDDILLAYGTTLVAAAARGDRALLVQIGDGDVLVADGGGVRRPIPRDPRLVANETTSLARPEAVADFRTADVEFAPGPAVIVVCSDGYTNSFASTEGFLQVAPDYLGIIRDGGMESVEQNLEGWLRQHSDEGSGDDVTVALIARNDGT